MRDEVRVGVAFNCSRQSIVRGKDDQVSTHQTQAVEVAAEKRERESTKSKGESGSRLPQLVGDGKNDGAEYARERTMEQCVGERERWSIGVREREIADEWAPLLLETQV